MDPKFFSRSTGFLFLKLPHRFTGRKPHKILFSCNLEINFHAIYKVLGLKTGSFVAHILWSCDNQKYFRSKVWKEKYFFDPSMVQNSMVLFLFWRILVAENLNHLILAICFAQNTRKRKGKEESCCDQTCLRSLFASKSERGEKRGEVES